MNHFKTKKIKGFSMPEVLISMFVLTIGLVAVISVINASLRSSYETRDALVATELAQEGVELVRNVRDNNFASGGDGFDNPTVFSTLTRHCRIDWNDAVSNLDCNILQGAQSRYNLQYRNGLFAHVNTSRERYARYIYIDFDSSGGDRALVRSFVGWGSFDVTSINLGDPARCNASTQCVYTETFLTSWR
jgi:prepilin-type N-terminal cleavage/methylation domain-containing protein